MTDVKVVLLGVGAIGRELLRQLATNHRTHGRQIRICALVDRSGFVLEPAGMSWHRVMELRSLKAAGTSVALADGGKWSTPDAAVAAIAAALPRGSVLVDATAADTHHLLEIALRRGFDLVLANKLPLAGPQTKVDQLAALAHDRGCRIEREATVGAGLPVIDTLHKLIEAGDRVSSVEGCPSGTLGFVFNELGKGRSFSAALRDAIDAGYTEPDPRTDLSGVDVARKALILARVLGFRGDLGDVVAESLVPPALEQVPLAEFLSRVAELDDAWAKRVRDAAARGCVLRYRARVTRTSIVVGLARVANDEPLGSLTGTDNQFIFTTSRYRERPLVITGPGAGPAVTAAGVYNDLLAIAARRRPQRPARRPRRDSGAQSLNWDFTSNPEPALQSR